MNNLIILQMPDFQCLYLDQVEAVVVVDCLRGGVCPVHTVEGEAFWFGIWLEGKTTFIGDFVALETWETNIFLLLFSIQIVIFNEYLVWVVYWAHICRTVGVNHILKI